MLLEMKKKIADIKHSVKDWIFLESCRKEAEKIEGKR